MSKFVTVVNEKEYEVNEEETVLQFLQRTGFFIFSLCGGMGNCGKCTIKVTGAFRNRKDGQIHEYDNEEILACQYCFASDSILYPQKQPEMKIETGLSEIKPTGQNELGIAIDIGTTTVALALYQLSDGRLINEVRERNCQIVYGSDVISRIEFTTHKGNLSLIREKTENQLKEMIKKAVGSDERKIKKIVITGNTIMLHLLKGMNVENIAVPPYKTDGLFGYSENINDIEVYYAPCISAYVGADITCGLNHLKPQENSWLFIDIGTNGETVLSGNGKMICTSAAAGPAFEGAEISCGMDASTGAVDRIYIEDDEIKYHVIGESEAMGICGSGLIDAVSVFLEKGIITRNGRFVSEGNYQDRIKTVNDKKCFFLTDRIYLSQEDIRQFQLAKSAIRTAIDILINVNKMNINSLEKVYIGGGFGQYVNIDNAIRTGLLPQFDRSIISVEGNTALKGAAELLSEESVIRYKEITYYPLAANGSFAAGFVKNLNF